MIYDPRHTTHDNLPDRIVINWPLVLGLLLLLGVVAYTSLTRLEIETDILATLPQEDPVVASARQVMLHHPLQNQIVIDIAAPEENIATLVQAAGMLEARLAASEHFEPATSARLQQQLPALMQYISTHLPMLFSADELQMQVAPRLTPEAIQKQLVHQQQQLQQLDGIGQIALLSQDPLELRYLVLARLRHLAPTAQAQIHRGHIVSADGRNLLLLVQPRRAGASMADHQQTADVLAHAGEAVRQHFAARNQSLRITSMGQYQAALDNEQIARRDVQRAVLYATLGIAVLLLLVFPRPLCGLLALLPALVGSLLALAAYTWLFGHISMLALGFGGAIIAITVDHGIAYSLFLDRPQHTWARHAAREIRAIGLLAALTTIGAFLLLTVSGFAILAQVGWFAALGIALSFGFVHLGMPALIPFMPAAARRTPSGIQHLADRLLGSGGRGRLFVAAFLTAIMLITAQPAFETDLRAMNTLRPQTRAAEAMIAGTWGDITARPLILLKADTLPALRRLSDQTAAMLEQATRQESLMGAFIGAQLFPGEAQVQRNLAAWQNFWQETGADWPAEFAMQAEAAGFRENAFAPFYVHINQTQAMAPEIPTELWDVAGLAHTEGQGAWYQYGSLMPGPRYDPEAFFAEMTRLEGLDLLDAAFFADRLGAFLARSFGIMLAVVISGIMLLLLLFFADWRLTLLALAPFGLALAGALGVLGALNRPLDLAGIMLLVVVLGLGIDYSLFLIRTRQHYGASNQPAAARVRLAVSLSIVSSLIGFGVLALAGHNMLKSAGMIAFWGIFFVALGNILILPPILERLYAPLGPFQPLADATPAVWRRQMQRRYRLLATAVRGRVWRRLRTDTLLARWPQVMPDPPRQVMLLNCGDGLVGLSLLAAFPEVRLYAQEPDSTSRRIARHVWDLSTPISPTELPDLISAPSEADLIVVDNGIHALAHHQLRDVLSNLATRLTHQGRVCLRMLKPLAVDASWRHLWRGRVDPSIFFDYALDDIQRLLADNGLRIESTAPASPGYVWIIAGNPTHTKHHVAT